MPVNDDDRQAELVLRELAHQMDNYIPAAGESWQACHDRRLKVLVADALAAHREQARRDAMEDAAKVAEDLDIDWSLGTAEHREAITAAIRAL